MKASDSSEDPDRQINAFLSSKPLKPSEDFATRVITAAITDEKSAASNTQHPSLLRYSLPIAALLAFALIISQLLTTEIPPPQTPGDALSAADVQELLLLQDGLSKLIPLSESDNFDSEQLLESLDILFLQIES